MSSYAPGTPLNVVTSVLVPDDTITPVNSASIAPSIEGNADNAMLAIQQLRPGLTATQLAAIVSPPEGAIRLLVQQTGPSNYSPVSVMRFSAGVLSFNSEWTAGANYVLAGDGSGIWLSTNAVQTLPGQPTFTGSQREPLIWGTANTRFVNAQDTAYSIPLSTFFPGEPGMSLGAASRIDGTNFGLVYAGILGSSEGLPGIMSLHSGANVFTFRTRLPRGSFKGLELCTRPNNTGVAPTSVDAAVNAPMSIRIYEVTTAPDFSTPGVSTYSSASLQTDVLTLVWTGTCGATGNNVGTTGGTGSGQNWVNSNIRRMNFLSGGSNTSSATCGATAAFNTSEEKEYMIAIRWPTFSGGDYATTWPSGMKPSIHKLTALMGVTTLGKV